MLPDRDRDSHKPCKGTKRANRRMAGPKRPFLPVFSLDQAVLCEPSAWPRCEMRQSLRAGVAKSRFAVNRALLMGRGCCRAILPQTTTWFGSSLAPPRRPDARRERRPAGCAVATPEREGNGIPANGTPCPEWRVLPIVEPASTWSKPTYEIPASAPRCVGGDSDRRDR